MLLSFLRYWLLKEDQYSLQSTYISSIYIGLIRFLKKKHKGDFQIEQLRAANLNSTVFIRVEDYGAGSKRVPGTLRPIKKITRYSTSATKFCLIYSYFCSLSPSDVVIELGTCLGISTRYLSQATKGKLYTFEGSPEIQRVAMKNFPSKNTEFIQGPIQSTLPEKLALLPKVDFALIDANHTYKGTMFAWNQLKEKLTPSSIVALADIHWSVEMEKAWEELKNDPEVTLTMDLFETGIFFFNYSGSKTHLILSI